MQLPSFTPRSHAASTYSIIGFAVHYFYYLVSTTSWVESNFSTCGKAAQKFSDKADTIHAKTTDRHYHT